MPLSWPSQSPTEVLDYQLNYATALAGDVINGSTWALSSGDITTTMNSFGPVTATIWLTGGVPNTIYTATNTVTTVAGRTFVEAVNIKIVNATS